MSTLKAEDVERRILIDEIKAIKAKSKLEKQHYLKHPFRKMLKGKQSSKTLGGNFTRHQWYTKIKFIEAKSDSKLWVKIPDVVQVT